MVELKPQEKKNGDIADAVSLFFAQRNHRKTNETSGKYKNGDK